MNRRPYSVPKMRIVAVHASGLVVAAGTAAATFALASGAANIFTAAFWVALGHAAFFGLPLYLLLRFRGLLPWWSAPLGGFVVGCIPIALLSLVPAADQASTGSTATVVDGMRTAAGWLEYLTLVLGAGALGSIGGVAFGLCIQGTLQRETLEQRLPRRRWILEISDFVAIGLACVFAVAAFGLPNLLMDRSCHNPMQGRKSLASEINFSLDVSPTEWPALIEVTRDFAHRHRWSYRDDVRPSPDFPWLQISVCDTIRTEFSAIRAGSLPGVQIGVYQPQGGSSWQRPFAEYYRAVHARWPDRTTFTGDHGQPIQPPRWLTSPTLKK